MSNSQGSFRLLPSIVKEENWFDKGIGGEGTLTAPPELQKILHGQLRNGRRPVVISTPIEDLKVFTTYKTIDELWDAQKTDPSYPIYRADEGDFLDDVPRNIPIGRGYFVANPRTVNLKYDRDEPNFERIVQEYEFDSPLYGKKIQAYVYHSRDGALEYTMYKNQKNQIWIANVGYTNSPITRHALRQEAIDSKELTAPLYEYGDQIPDSYRTNNRINGSSYESNWNYIREMPLIQRWFKENEIPMSSKEIMRGNTSLILNYKIFWRWDFYSNLPIPAI